MQTGLDSAYQWFRAGDEIFPATLAAIDAASRSVCLEIYTFEECPHDHPWSFGGLFTLAAMLVAFALNAINPFRGRATRGRRVA